MQASAQRRKARCGAAASLTVAFGSVAAFARVECSGRHATCNSTCVVCARQVFETYHEDGTPLGSELRAVCHAQVDRKQRPVPRSAALNALCRRCTQPLHQNCGRLLSVLSGMLHG
jgi:hypothetical protein